MMLGAPGPLTQFGNISNATREGTTTLYRAVLQNELDDIAAAERIVCHRVKLRLKGFLVLQKKQLGLRVKCFSVRQEKGRTQLPRPRCQTHFYGEISGNILPEKEMPCFFEQCRLVQ